MEVVLKWLVLVYMYDLRVDNSNGRRLQITETNVYNRTACSMYISAAFPFFVLLHFTARNFCTILKIHVIVALFFSLYKWLQAHVIPKFNCHIFIHYSTLSSTDDVSDNGHKFECSV